jgi:hypothetical protein
MCVAPQMRHFSSRCPPSVFPVAFHGHPDFLMWQMHGLLVVSGLPFPTWRLLLIRPLSYTALTMRDTGPRFKPGECYRPAPRSVGAKTG